MMNFLRLLKKNLLNILPLHVAYVLICCIFVFVNGPGSADMFGLMLLGFISELCAVFMAVEENIRNSISSPYKKLTRGCFKGVTKPAKHFSLGTYEMEEHMYAEALEDFKIVEEYKMSKREIAVLSFYIGSCYSAMGYPTNAAKYLKQSLENDIDIDFVYVLAARACVANGSFDDAMNIYDRLIERNCYFDYIYTDMGMCCLKSQKYDEARGWFEKSVNEGKNYAFALGGCSLVALAEKDVEESKQLFSKALMNNLEDLDGFRAYYCEVAEASGCLDLIDENMKRKPGDEVVTEKSEA